MLPSQCKEIDQPCWALVQDLKQRGMLDDTLVILARRIRPHDLLPGQADADRLRPRPPSALLQPLDGRRRHQGRRGARRDGRFSYNIVKDPVHVRDFQATILHQFGIDHERFTYKFQGLDQKLTGTDQAFVVKGILA